MATFQCLQECVAPDQTERMMWAVSALSSFFLFNLFCGRHPKLQTRSLWTLPLCCTFIVHFPQGKTAALPLPLAGTWRLLEAGAALRHSDTSPKPLTYRSAAAGAWRIKPGTPGLLCRRLMTLSFACAKRRITVGPLPPVISPLWSWRRSPVILDRGRWRAGGGWTVRRKNKWASSTLCEKGIDVFSSPPFFLFLAATLHTVAGELIHRSAGWHYLSGN